jgi:oligoribonuclease NrnB/cAMP/cGMP phosphodiesterase (DHH superfamily)
MRLLTRSDFDGLACAALLAEKKVIEEYKFVHPKDVQDGKVDVTENDVLANVPYVEGCGLWFDHHASEDSRLKGSAQTFAGESRAADSAAQVIWDYYGGVEAFGERFIPFLEAVNKSDSGKLDKDDILNPEGWMLLSFIMDPRTGLGRFMDYRISNYQLMADMFQYIRTKNVDEILDIPDVQERIKRYFEQHTLYMDMLRRCCTIDGNVIITNLMNEKIIFCGNRFLVYAAYPEQDIEIRTMLSKDKQAVVFAVGKSILNRSSTVDVGELMLKHGGGGHTAVGTCQVPIDIWQNVQEDILEACKKDR